MEKKCKITVVGDVSEGEPANNGQTAKTREYIHYLKNRYGDSNVSYVDTSKWRKKILSKTVSLIKAMFRSEVLVLVLGANGRKVILPVTLLFRPFTGNTILFSIVGGSLMYGFDQEPNTVKNLSKVDAVFVETKMFESFLKNRGISNVWYSPCFSKRKSITQDTIPEISMSEPFRFCTYARVCKEKGISSAIDAVCKVNEAAGKIVCTLDIYGVPQEEYREEFEEKLSRAGTCVSIHPYLDDTNAIDTLSEHYMMLFPTYYKGEGFPIAIIESLKSGLPVIASDWHFNKEVVVDHQTGLVYDLQNAEDLVNLVSWAINNPEKVFEMKKNCIDRAHLFDPDTALSPIYDIIDKG